jgi:hypothetical protein
VAAAGMTIQTLTIDRAEPQSLNSVLEAAKSHWGAYSKDKKARTISVAMLARSQKLKPCKTPPNIRITFWQKDKRIEKDNLLVNTKYLLDGLVEGGILPDDRWDSYLSLGFRYEIDRTNPRIVIQLIEDPT